MPKSAHAQSARADIDYSLSMRREIRDIAQRIEETLAKSDDDRAIMTVFFLKVTLELKRHELDVMTERASA